MFGHLAYFANLRNPYGYLLFLFFAVGVNDVAAFTIGKRLGTGSCAARSARTRRGAEPVGAFAVSLLMPWVLRFSLPEFDVGALVLTGLIVGIGGQLGDLTISFIKGDWGSKIWGI